MPKLFLTESPCGFCARLTVQSSTLVFEGGSRTVETASCSIVSDGEQFRKYRNGVEEDGETKFPWCPYIKRRAS